MKMQRDAKIRKLEVQFKINTATSKSIALKYEKQKASTKRYYSKFKHNAGKQILYKLHKEIQHLRTELHAAEDENCKFKELVTDLSSNSTVHVRKDGKNSLITCAK